MGLLSFVKNIFKAVYNPAKDRKNRFDDSDYDPVQFDGVGHKRKNGRLTEYEEFLKLYGNHPAVYVCASRIARSAASVKYQFLQNGKEAKPKVGSVLKRPNPQDTWGAFIEKTYLYLELCGNVFWEIVRDPISSEIIAMFVLLPHKMKILPHPKKYVSGYIYEPKLGTEILYDPSEIVHIKYPDPLDEYWGIAPTMAATNSLTLDFYAIGWNKKFFKDGAEPGGTLETDQSLTTVAWERLRQTWLQRHQGIKNAHIPAILEEGLKYRPIAMKHSEMEFAKMREMNKDDVHACYGVPIDMTKSDSRKAFWHDNIFPKLNRLAEVINTTLSNPEPGKTEDVDNLEIIFLVRSVESMLEDELTKSQIAQSNVSHGIWTINETRERQYGMGKKPWGETYWAPVGLAPYDSGAHPSTPSGNDDPNKPGKGVKTPYLAGEKSPYQVPKVGQPSRLDQYRGKRHPETAFFNVIKEEYQDLDTIDPGEPDWKDKKQVFMWKAWVQWQKAAAPDEKKFIKMMREFFAEQFERARNKIRAHGWKVKKDEGDPDVDAFLLDVDEENKLLAKKYEKVGKEILNKHGQITLGNLGIDANFDISRPEVIKWMDEWSASRVTGINEYTRELMRKSLVDSAKGGEDFEDTMTRLGQVFLESEGAPVSEFRARRIARTETVTLTNQGRLEAAKQTGVVKRKMWVSQRIATTRDGKYGENHLELHGTIIPIHDKFTAKSRSGEDEMDGPGDISASAENVCFCLCVLEYPPEDEEFADLFEEAVNTGQVEKKGNKKGEDVNINVNVGNMDVKKALEDLEKKDAITEDIRKAIVDLSKKENNVIVNVPAPQVIVNVPEQKTPIVNVETKAPVINMPEQKAPIVNVNPEIKVESPDVNVSVNPEMKIPKTVEKTRITRDDKGRMTGSIKETEQEKE